MRLIRASQARPGPSTEADRGRGGSAGRWRPHRAEIAERFEGHRDDPVVDQSLKKASAWSEMHDEGDAGTIGAEWIEVPVQLCGADPETAWSLREVIGGGAHPELDSSRLRVPLVHHS